MADCKAFMWDPSNPFNNRAHECRDEEGHAGPHRCKHANGTPDGCTYQWPATPETTRPVTLEEPDITARLEAILRDLYDEEPCRYDHHGFCQEHGWLTSPDEDITDKSDRGVCPHRRAQEYFASRSGPPSSGRGAKPESDNG